MRRLLIILAAVVCATPLAAQDVSGATNACFGFAFGRWNPPLDWSKAGHAAPPHQVGPDAGTAQDGGRREWAADQTERGKIEMVLFPAWWPVGVHVELADVGGDTLRGTATALVADGRVTPPVAKVAALRVVCGDRTADRPVAPADDPAPADTVRRAPARRATSAARRPG